MTMMTIAAITIAAEWRYHAFELRHSARPVA
jgi:hypothetical protein